MSRLFSSPIDQPPSELLYAEWEIKRRQVELAAQQTQYNYNAGMQQAAINQSPPPRPQPTIPLQWRSKDAVGNCTRRLPHKVLAQITDITFDLPKMVYIVHFRGGREEEFDDIDHFPTEADITRILLVCP